MNLATNKKWRLCQKCGITILKFKFSYDIFPTSSDEEGMILIIIIRSRYEVDVMIIRLLDNFFYEL